MNPNAYESTSLNSGYPPASAPPDDREIATAIQAQEFGEVRQAHFNTGITRPVNRWRDGLCDCFKNLFPSCFCVVCCCDGCYLLGQMSAKTGYTDFVKVVLSFAVLWIICIIVQISAPGAAVVAWLPYIFLMVFVVLLRSHIMRRDNIPGAGSCTECLTVAFCYPCAVTQMARHLYGYQKILDGDADPTRPDQYGPENV